MDHINRTQLTLTVLMLFWSDSMVGWFCSMIIFDIFLAGALDLFRRRSIDSHWSLGRINSLVLGSNYLFCWINISVIWIVLLVLLWLMICGLLDSCDLWSCVSGILGMRFLVFLVCVFVFFAVVVVVPIYTILTGSNFSFLLLVFYRCHGFEYFPQLIY